VTLDGFGEFYAARKDAVFRAVLVVAGNRVSAEDAVAEAFTRACARWASVSERRCGGGGYDGSRPIDTPT
jgi:hypothetical protein